MKTVKKVTRCILKTLKWLAICVAGLVVLVSAIIYLPPVQDFVIEEALKSINAGDSGMHIAIRQFRLNFPLSIEAEAVEVQSPGMEISTAKISTDIAFLPLFKADIHVNSIALDSATVNIGTRDSSLYMRSSIGNVKIADASVGLLSKRIDVGMLAAEKGNIDMVLTPDTVAKPAQDEMPLPWNISLHKVRLARIAYAMQMPPSIDNLSCNIQAADLTDSQIILNSNTIRISDIAIAGVDASYIVPRSAADTISQQATDATPSDTATTAKLWDITADRIRLTHSHAIYATAGASPTGSNFDPLYIEASDIDIEIDSLSNCGTSIRVPLTLLSARERCGISLSASGTFEMDSIMMRAKNFDISTPASQIKLNATFGLDSVNPPLNLAMNAMISPDDLKRLMPEEAAPIAASLPPYTPLTIEADIQGHMNQLKINRAKAEIARHISIEATGDIAGYSDIDTATGHVEISGSIPDGNFIKPALLDAKTGRQVNLPPLRITGTATATRGTLYGNLKAITGTGNVALEAEWDNRHESYDISVDLNSFPVQSILPLSGARDIDATATVSGSGLDLFKPSTQAAANIVLRHIGFNSHEYNDITLNANLADGHADIEATSRNKGANFVLKADGNITDDTFNWNFNGDIKNIDLHTLAISDTTSDGSVKLSGNISLRPAIAKTQRHPGRSMTVNAKLNIADLYWHMPGDAINATGIDLAFNTDSVSTQASLANNGLTLEFSSRVPLDTLLRHIEWTSLALKRDMARRRLSIDTLQHAMPPFDLKLNAGADNILSNYLLGQDMAFKRISLEASNDSAIALQAQIYGIRNGETHIDTITVDMRQRSEYLLYDANMHNTGTLDPFASINARGYINADRIALLFKQQDNAGETGYSIGAMARVTDTTKVELRFVPYHPIIGYKEWEINKDNLIVYDLESQHIDANLNLHNSVSNIHLFTEHHEGDSLQEDLMLKVTDIKLSDWMAINPFAPPVTGNLSADMRLSWQKPDLNGSGTVTLSDFFYGKKRVGDFQLALDVKTNAAGTIRANTSLAVDGVKAITASGNLNDSLAEHPFLLDFKMIRFPLAIANPFLPPGTATLSGVLNGEMDITGEMSDPILNGFLDFDTTTVNIDMLGTPLKVSDRKIPVEDNIVHLENFAITGVNDKPMRINGTVDLTSVSSPKLDLAIEAHDMQIVGSSKSRKTQVYGKAFIDLDAKVKGSTSFLNVDASLGLLPGTNVTYVMADAMTQLTSRSNQDMVKFINFNDTTTVAQADSVPAPSMLMNLDARLTISQGTTVTVELDPQGNSKAQIQSSGSLNYTMDYMDDERFTGRISINQGFVRYAVPVIGEKQFSFKEGSYIEFNGDMLNPSLNIKAYDEVRANVAQDGSNSRVVNFDIELAATGTLNQMGVVFDLSCPDDITIANELKSMTQEQRANQAMNLLLYNTYRSGGTQTISSGNAGTNALFNFLESQLNTWASSAIKGVDISFGINQYDKTVNGANTTSMNYSYRVSKSLFDDRFKIVVGGNYTTDAEADENFAQNLIADISFEYLLNKAGTMYVRLFRHTGYESILEGEITQTGVGFVYKRKIGRLSDLFKFLRQDNNRPTISAQHGNDAQQPAGKPVPKADTATATTKDNHSDDESAN